MNAKLVASLVHVHHHYNMNSLTALSCMLLLDGEDLSCSDLASITKVSASAITTIRERCEVAGLMISYGVPHDKRVTYLALTGKGKDLVKWFRVNASAGVPTEHS